MGRRPASAQLRKEFMKNSPSFSALFVGLAVVAMPLNAQVSPYTDLESREIKALSEGQVQGYLEGRGLSFALAGELNSYPGPRHVIDMADDLELTREQLQCATELFDEMQVSAMELGEQYVSAERELDELFAEQSIGDTRLAEVTRTLGRLRGELRYVHLAAHLRMKEILSAHQVAMYDVLRGYGGRGEAGHQHNLD